MLRPIHLLQPDGTRTGTLAVEEPFEIPQIREHPKPAAPEAVFDDALQGG